MAGILDDLKRTFRQGNIVVRLIYINVAVYIVSMLLGVVLGLFNIGISEWLYRLYLPADLLQLLRRPWTLVTYMFMHAGLWHLLGNISLFLLRQAFAWTLCRRRVVGCTSLYTGL